MTSATSFFKHGYINRAVEHAYPDGERLLELEAAVLNPQLPIQNTLEAVRELILSVENGPYIGGKATLVETGKGKVRIFETIPSPYFREKKLIGSFEGCFVGVICSSTRKKQYDFDYETIRINIGQIVAAAKAFQDLFLKKGPFPGIIGSMFIIRLPEFAFPIMVTKSNKANLHTFLNQRNASLAFSPEVLKQYFSMLCGITVAFASLEKYRLFSLSIRDEDFWTKIKGGFRTAKLFPLSTFFELPLPTDEKGLKQLFSHPEKFQRNFCYRPWLFPAEIKELIVSFSHFFRSYLRDGKVDVLEYNLFYQQYLKALTFNFAVLVVRLFTLDPHDTYLKVEGEGKEICIVSIDREAIDLRMRKLNLPHLMGEENYIAFRDRLFEQFLNLDPAERPTPAQVLDWAKVFMKDYYDWGKLERKALL